MNQTVLFLVFTFICLVPLYGQSDFKISGQILNGSAEGIPFVNVYDLTNAKGVVSDQEGFFSLKTNSSSTVLKISFVGYQTIIDTVFKEHTTSMLKYQLVSDVFGLDQVVVTGSRNEENIREAVSAINVTDSKALELVQAITLSDGLNFQPGLRTETNCQNCGYSQVRINGLPGAYSQILINGRQTFSALNSVYGLEQIPAVLIDRIEIVKGGGSALYGANAMGGVINLITKDPLVSGIEVGLNTGMIDFKSWEVNADILGAYVAKNNKFGMNIIGGYRLREAYDANGDGYTELPVLNNYTGELKLYYKPFKLHRFNVSVRSSYEYRRGGDQIEMQPEHTNISEQLKNSVLGGDLSYEFYSKNKLNKFDFYGSSQFTHMDNYYGVGFDVNGYGLTTDFTSIAGLNYTHFFNKILKEGSASIILGSEYRNNQISDSKPGYGIDISQDIQYLGVFGQFDWKIIKWLKISAGLRGDIDNVLNQFMLNPRAGVLLDLKKGIQIRANYSRGYMAPQLFSDEIHAEIVSGQFRQVLLGENLKNETSNTVTVGVNYTYRKQNHELFFGIDVFYTEIVNPFVLENKWIDSSLVLEKVNSDQSLVAGINLEFKYAFKEYFRLQSAFTIQTSKYKTPLEWTSGETVHQFMKSPNYYGNVILSTVPIKSFTISTTLNITGPMLIPHYDGYIPNDQLEKSPWFFDWGLKLSYDLDIGKYCLIFDLGMRNLLNSYQSDFDMGASRDGGYVYGPQRPRTLFFGMRFFTF